MKRKDKQSQFSKQKYIKQNEGTKQEKKEDLEIKTDDLDMASPIKDLLENQDQSYQELLKLSPPESKQESKQELQDIQSPVYSSILNIPKKKRNRVKKERKFKPQNFINFLIEEIEIYKYSPTENEKDIYHKFETFVLDLGIDGFQVYNVRKGFYHVKFKDEFFKNVEHFNVRVENHTKTEEFKDLLKEHKEQTFELDLSTCMENEITNGSFISIKFEVKMKDEIKVLRSKLFRLRQDQTMKFQLSKNIHEKNFLLSRENYEKIMNKE